MDVRFKNMCIFIATNEQMNGAQNETNEQKKNWITVKQTEVGEVAGAQIVKWFSWVCVFYITLH